MVALNPNEVRPFRRFNIFWNVVTYLMLGLVVVFTLFDRSLLPWARWASLGLAVVWALWYVIFVAGYRRFEWQLWLRGGLFAPMIAVSMVMARPLGS